MERARRALPRVAAADPLDRVELAGEWEGKAAG